MEREEVRHRVDVIWRLRLLDSELAVALGRHVGVEGDDVHGERARPLGHELPDPAKAEDAQCLLV